ncbi:MAG: hypothetical protein AAF702_11185 [Chloroflexota bacterium]
MGLGTLLFCTRANLSSVQSVPVPIRCCVPLQAGEPFSYTINVGNAGPSPTNNVVVQSMLPLGVLLVELPTFCTSVQTTDPVGEHLSITCHLGSWMEGRPRN